MPKSLRKLINRFRSSKARSRAQLLAGNEKLSGGTPDEAVTHYREAVALNSGSSDAYLRLGYALRECNLFPEAQSAFEASLSLNSENAEAKYFLGSLALETKDYLPAAAYFIAALDIDPGIQPAYGDAALALFRLGQTSEAVSVLERGITRFPTDANFLFLKGNVLAERGRHSEAAETYRKALALVPGHASSLANLGNCERHLGRTDRAIEYLRRALLIQPANAAWHSNLLFTLQYTGELSAEALFREHLQYAEKFEAPFRAKWPDHAKTPLKSGNRLRIGYVSGDFRDHALTYFIAPILSNHDREKVDIFCYYTYSVHDRVTKRLRELADHWRDCFDISDNAMAELIRNDCIDVLVDLSGHTGHNRLPVFALKPAPVQVTWLGYQATTGLSAMDYRITDAGIDPEQLAETHHSEKLMRLSSGAVFQPDLHSPEVNRLPALTTGIFTYGCLNNPAKITPAFIDAAACILLGSKNTRLLFGNATTESRAELTTAFCERGVSAERLEFIERKSSADYLRVHHTIDLALDTFPYNGGTTTLHSQWMGVPIVALEGDSALSRVGSQIMRGLGLPSFACKDMAAYIARAIALSSDHDYMQMIRSGLRKRMEQVTVENASSFVSELEFHFLAARQEVNSAPRSGNSSSP